MGFLWFKTKSERELHELQLKSHYIKSLGTYMFMSYDIFAKTSERYPNISLGTIAKAGKDAKCMTLDLIHSTIVQYREVAALEGFKVKEIRRQDLEKWFYYHSDEYDAALNHITKCIHALKKKAEAQRE